MAKVFIGVDPHKLSATIEVVDEREKVLATGRFSTDKTGYAAMRQHVAPATRSGCGRWRAATAPAGRWRSGCSRMGSRWWTCRPSCPRGPASSTPATTARPTPTMRTPSAVVAVRTSGVRVLAYDVQLEALRMLADRRDELSKTRVQAANRLHRLLAELGPGTT